MNDTGTSILITFLTIAMHTTHGKIHAHAHSCMSFNCELCEKAIKRTSHYLKPD